MKRIICLSIILSVCACQSKPSLSNDDKSYIHTTLDLMRVRAKMKPELDSVTVKLILDTAYRRHNTTREAYLKQTSALADNPKVAELVYNAINDSTGAK